MIPFQACLRGIPVSSELDNWRGWPDFTPKDLKFLDRQTALLYQTTRDLLTRDFPRTSAAVHIAVGPARTELETMMRWANRITADEPLPMVQPAGAVGLLPNTPLSWLSIKLGLTGEGSVWAGFEEAGYAALSAARDALQLNVYDEALVAAVSSPHSYFVLDGFKRGFYAPVPPLTEVCVAFRLFSPPRDEKSETTEDQENHKGHENQGSHKQAELERLPRLIALEDFPAGTSVPKMLSALFSFLPESEGISPNTAAVSSFSAEEAVIDGLDERRDLSNHFGAAMPAALPLAICLAGHGVFGYRPIPILLAAPFGAICAALVLPGIPTTEIKENPSHFPPGLTPLSLAEYAVRSCGTRRQRGEN